MVRALYSSASGMMGQQMNIDVLSHNLVNVNTSGYKRSNLQFEDVMYQTEKMPGARLNNGDTTPGSLQVGLGVKPVATAKSYGQGALVSTGEKYDLAIQGRGFFQITLPDGSYAYSRDGSFKVNSQGTLVTNEGYVVTGVDQIDPQATEVGIARDGTVSVTVNGAVQQLTPITLTIFANEQGLKAIGDNLLQETDASGQAQTGQTPGLNGTGTIAQGFVEASNVRVVEEMVRLIQAQRAYEVNSKAIQASDEMLGMANNLRR